MVTTSRFHSIIMIYLLHVVLDRMAFSFLILVCATDVHTIIIIYNYTHRNNIIIWTNHSQATYPTIGWLIPRFSSLFLFLK